MTVDHTMLSLTGAAAVLRVTYPTVRKYVRKGLLQGDDTAVTAESVEALRIQRMSELERAWETHWQRHGNSEPYASEWYFDTERRWRFDVAFLAQHVAVELHGGTWRGGRHVRPAGYQDDGAKINAAQLAGWRVLEFTTDMLADDPERCCAQVVALLERSRA